MTAIEKIANKFEIIKQTFKTGIETLNPIERKTLDCFIAILNELENDISILLAEERAQKPTADKELVEALEKLARLGNGNEYGNSDGNRIAQDALARYKPTESLAELADRRGIVYMDFRVSIYQIMVRELETRKQYTICVLEPINQKRLLFFNGDTHAEAESKARAYLESLSDKKEEGK